MKDYMTMFNEALDVVHDLGIETGNIVDVKLNYRAKNRFGQCRRNNIYNTYELNFNHLIFADEADDDAVMNVLIHEILHTCEGGMTHKGEWKRLANIVNANTKYNITRTNSYENFGIEKPTREKKHNYVFYCEDCGQVIVRERASKFTKNYHAYRCGKCGGEIRFDAEKSNYQILTVNPRYSYVENR